MYVTFIGSGQGPTEVLEFPGLPDFLSDLNLKKDTWKTYIVKDVLYVYLNVSVLFLYGKKGKAIQLNF